MGEWTAAALVYALVCWNPWLLVIHAYAWGLETAVEKWLVEAGRIGASDIQGQMDCFTQGTLSLR